MGCLGVPGQEPLGIGTANLPGGCMPRVCEQVGDGCLLQGPGCSSPVAPTQDMQPPHPSPTVGPDPAQTQGACGLGLCWCLKASTRLRSVAAPGAGWGRGPVIYRGDMCFT